MPYDDAFYAAYERYLHEPRVREAHDFIFSIVRKDPAFQRVIDLGCGECQEFRRFFDPSKYVGIDLHAPSAHIKADYRRIMSLLAEGKHPELDSWDAFVSLFSSEITEHFLCNYMLYDRLFVLRPETKAGLVSGFFYANRHEFTEVEETGGITSYQTVEDIDQVSSAFFRETRITLPVPSEMFGDDVFEVWKIFTKV